MSVQNKIVPISLVVMSLVLSPIDCVTPISAYTGIAAAQSLDGSSSEQVNIPDPVLEKAIRATLKKPDGIITRADMEKLIKFPDYAQYENLSYIRDLTGLEYAVNLEVLSIVDSSDSQDGISDLSPIKNLTKLKHLAIWSPKITDISLISNLTNLEEVSFDSCSIERIPDVSKLYKLKRLYLSDNKIKDISSLREFRYRYADVEIWLGSNEIQDISPLLEVVKKNNWTYGKIDMAFNRVNLTDPMNISKINSIRQSGVIFFIRPQQGRLSGVLLDNQGKPVPNVKISIKGSVPRDQEGNPPRLDVTASAVTNKYGEYSINESVHLLPFSRTVDVPYVYSGPYTMTIETPGLPVQQLPFEVFGGVQTVLNLSQTQESKWTITPPSTKPSYLTQYIATDINGNWAEQTIKNAMRADIVKGIVQPDGTIAANPENQITRAEFVTLLVRALNLQSSSPGKSFADIDPNSWYSDYVRIASSLGIVNGVTNDEFMPNRMIQRDEIVALLIRAFSSSISFEGAEKKFSDVPNYWATEYIQKASKAGIVNGYPDGLFKPSNAASRAEAIQIIMNALQREQLHVPDNQTLTNVVIQNEVESLAALNAADFDRLFKINETFATGYYKALYDWTTESSKKLSLQGFTQQQVLKATLDARVISKSDRLASVELSGAVYEGTVTRDNQMIRQETADTSGIIQLKKCTDGVWRIYSHTKL